MKKTKLLALCAALSFCAHAATPITLGLNYPRTGNYKEEGLDQMRAALLAIDEINTAGGVMGRPLQISSYNSASRPEKALKNVDKLAKEGVAMIFGGSSSAVAIAAGKRAKEHGLLYFGTLTYSNATTGKDGHRYIFRESNNAWMSAKVLGQYLNKNFPNKNYFYITSDYTWGHSSEESLRKVTNTLDPKRHPSIRVPFPDAQRSHYQHALEAAAQSNAEVLVLVLFGNDLVQAMPIVHALGLNERIQIAVPNLTINMVAKAGSTIMQGVIGTEPWTWHTPQEVNSPKGQAFVKAYYERYQIYPSSSAASAYSIVYQWADAAKRAKSLKSEDLIKALEGHRYSLLKDEQYWRQFDHQNVQSVYAVRVSNKASSIKAIQSQDFFEVIGQMSGDQAAQTLTEWQAVRKSANQPLYLD